MRTKEIHNKIISRCLDGDRSAQEELYGLYSRQMYSVCLRILKHREDAEDVLQESFVTAFKALETFRNEANFGAWLKRIVLNKSLNFLKKKKIKFEEMSEEVEEVEEIYIPESEITIEAIKETIESLPHGYRLVFTLYMFEDMSHKEIATHLDISESTSKSQLNRAKKKLKSILNQQYHGTR